MTDAFKTALHNLPAGRYAVGASAGADSTALVRLLHAYRPDCAMTLVHLDHGLRGSESTRDAEFVRGLAQSLGLECRVEHLSAIEKPIKDSIQDSLGDSLEHSMRDSIPPSTANASARYRAARLAFFDCIVRERNLDGVVLAHHADDQAESVMLRLLRGGGLLSLAGMSAVRTVGGLTIHRPLLDVRREQLRRYLDGLGQSWREDSSNASDAYRRNVVRKVLQADRPLIELLIELGAAAARLRAALDAAAPVLEDRFAGARLAGPAVLAEYAARRWLVARGAPADDLSPRTCRRLVLQAIDASQSPRQHYPGRLLVRRRQKHIDVMPA